MEEQQPNFEEVSAPASSQPNNRRNKSKPIIIVVLVCIALALALHFFFDVFSSKPTPAANPIVTAGQVPPIDPQSIGKIVVEPGTGKQFMSNQIILGFKAGVSVEEIQKTIDIVDGKMLQRFTSVPLFLVQVPDEGDGSKAIAAVEKLKKNPNLDDVGLNYLTVAKTPETNK